MKHGVSFALLAAALAAGLLAGCSDDDEVTKPACSWPSPYKKPTTPENVIYNLQRALEERDPAWFDSLLYDAEANGDTVTSFHFSANQTTQGWFAGRAGFLERLDWLFSSPHVEQIAVEMTCGDPALVMDPPRTGLMRATVDTMALGADVRDPVSNDVTRLAAPSHDGWLTFKVQYVDRCGDSIWRIAGWEHHGPWFDRELPVQKPPTSPENVLFNLRQAYRFRKTAWYDSLLYDADAAGDTAESYLFRFWEWDVGNGNVPGPTWGRAPELASAAAMFADPQVEDIDLSLTWVPAYDDTAAGHGGQRIILVTNATLNLVTRLENSTEPIIYRVTANLARFRFKTQYVGAGADSIWRVVCWEDLGEPFAVKVRNTTWGKIKSMWAN